MSLKRNIESQNHPKTLICVFDVTTGLCGLHCAHLSNWLRRFLKPFGAFWADSIPRLNSSALTQIEAWQMERANFGWFCDPWMIFVCFCAHVEQEITIDSLSKLSLYLTFNF